MKQWVSTAQNKKKRLLSQPRVDQWHLPAGNRKLLPTHELQSVPRILVSCWAASHSHNSPPPFVQENTAGQRRKRELLQSRSGAIFHLKATAVAANAVMMHAKDTVLINYDDRSTLIFPNYHIWSFGPYISLLVRTRWWETKLSLVHLLMLNHCQGHRGALSQYQ